MAWGGKSNHGLWREKCRFTDGEKNRVTDRKTDAAMARNVMEMVNEKKRRGKTGNGTCGWRQETTKLDMLEPQGDSRGDGKIQ